MSTLLLASQFISLYASLFFQPIFLNTANDRKQDSVSQATYLHSFYFILRLYKIKMYNFNSDLNTF